MLTTMQKAVYNIIWADDEVHELMREELKKKFLIDNHINVVAAVTTGTEFRLKFEELKHQIDAVITDANFNKIESLPNDDRDMSGFTVVRQVFHTISSSDREIPFFLYTGRGQFIAEKYTDGELDYFTETNRIFTKDKFKQLCERIPKDIDAINSPSYRIRKKYKNAFDKASIIQENENTLFRMILSHAGGCKQDLHVVQDDFNSLRKIIESILDDGKNKGLFPTQIDSLNTFKRFLKNEDSSIEWNVFECPSSLAHEVGFLIDFSQDGSHKYEGLKLKADQYVSNVGNDYLLMSLTYIAMDFCIWYFDLLQAFDGAPTWKERVTEKGAITRNRSKFYYGSAEIQTLKEGDEIEVRKTRPHGHPYTIYDDTTKETRMIDSFIALGDYKILPRKKDKTDSTTNYLNSFK